MKHKIKYVNVEITPQEKKLLIKAKEIARTRGLSTFLRNAGIEKAEKIIQEAKSAN